MDCGDNIECQNRNIITDDTIVNWEIKGLCDVGGNEGNCAILAYDDLDQDIITRRHSDNTEISEGLINGAGFNDFLVLDIKPDVGFNKGDIGRVINKPNINIHSFIIDPNFTKPVLQFSIINKLKEKDPLIENVPYLEYQIVYKSSEPLPNSMRYVEAEGISQGYVKRLSVGVGQESSISGFVIQN